MQRTKWFPPYYRIGKAVKTTLLDRWDEKKGGVYFIRKKGGALKYIGFSRQQLKKTIYRHFQEWYDKSRPVGERNRIVYSKFGYEVRFIETTARQAERLERFLINKYSPPDNEQVYEGFCDKLTAPSEKTLNEWGTEAEMAPFLKKK